MENNVLNDEQGTYENTMRKLSRMEFVDLSSVKLEKVTLYLAVETYGTESTPDGLTTVLQALQGTDDSGNGYDLRIIDYKSEQLRLVEEKEVSNEY